MTISVFFPSKYGDFLRFFPNTPLLLFFIKGTDFLLKQLPENLLTKSYEKSKQNAIKKIL